MENRGSAPLFPTPNVRRLRSKPAADPVFPEKVVKKIFVILFFIDILFFIIILGSKRRTPMEAYATVKGQIVIPSRIRRKLGITENTRIQIDVDEENKKIVLTPITRDYIHSVRGRLKGKGLLKSLAAEKKIEKEL